MLKSKNFYRSYSELLKIAVEIGSLKSVPIDKFGSNVVKFYNSLETSLQNSQWFLKNNRALIKNTKEIINHSQIHKTFKYWLEFFPPVVETQLLTKILNIVRKEMAKNSNGISNSITIQKLNELCLKAIISKFDNNDYAGDQIAALRPAELINRWFRNKPDKLLMKSSAKNPVLKKIQKLYPYTGKIHFKTIQECTFDADLLEGSVEYGSGNITIIFAENVKYKDKLLSTRERNLFLAAVITHELAHGFDILTNLNLMKYVPKDDLPNIYEKRLASINLEQIVKTPYINNKYNNAILRQKLAETRPNPVDREISSYSIDELKDACLLYPQIIFMEPGSSPTLCRKLKKILIGRNNQNYSTEMLAGLSIFSCRAISEYLAEIGGFYLF